MSTVEPTEAELRMAWKHCHGRPNWPPTFEEAMADATFSRLLRLTAKHPPRAARSGRVSTPAAAPEPHQRSDAPRWTPPRQAALFDRKRAAAGEREDD